MRISTIAFANLKRRKGKAVFLIVGIAIGIGTAVALLSLSSLIKEEIGTQLDRFGANIVVLPESNTLALDSGGIPVSSVAYDVQKLTTEDATNILDIPYRNRISVVAPKMIGAISIASENGKAEQVPFAGVDFDSELALKRWWQMVGRKPEQENEVVVGYEVARALAIIEPLSEQAREVSHQDSHNHHTDTHHDPFKIVRDRLTIKLMRDGKALKDEEHTVVGVLMETGDRGQDTSVYGSIGHVQSFLNSQNELTYIEVSALCKDCPVEDIVAQISERLPHAKVSALQQSVRARADTIERLTRFFAIVSAIVLAIGALMIFTTMMGSVIERTKEIGVLRAIGFRKAHIIKELMIEVAAISLAGGLLGWGAGMLASWAALPYFAETEITFAVRPALALLAIGAGLIIGIASSFYPIIRASRLDPSEAVRYV